MERTSHTRTGSVSLSLSHTQTHTHTHIHFYSTPSLPYTSLSRLVLPILLSAVTLTNLQVALKGIETSGYVVASSNKAQIFGQEHQPVLKEGDLMSKKSWLACVDKLQVCIY